MGASSSAAAADRGLRRLARQRLLTTKVVETLEAEVTGLREQFQAGGAERLAAVVAQRADAAGLRASICWSTPPAARSRATSTGCRRSSGADRRGGVFNYARPSQDDPAAVARLAVGVPLPVPGGLAADRRPRHRGSAPIRRHHGPAGLSWSIGAALRARHRRRPADQPQRARRIETITDASRTHHGRRSVQAHPARRLRRRARSPRLRASTPCSRASRS